MKEAIDAKAKKRTISTVGVYGYKIDTYWSNIATVESYYKTNMDFLKPEVRDYFFNQYPEIYSKIDDLPPAKYNPGNSVKSGSCSINTSVSGSKIPNAAS